MGIFSRKPKLPLSKQAIDDAIDELGIAKLNGLSVAIESAIEKAYSISQFQIDPNDFNGGNESGYFGREFELRATVGRIKSLYSKEPWVYASASTIAKTLSTVNFKVRQKSTKELLEAHPLQKSLDAGNPTQDCKSLNWAGYLDLVLSGNFFKIFDEKYTIPVHVPTELASLKMRENKTNEDKLLMEEVGPVSAVSVNYNYLTNTPAKDIDYRYVIQAKFPNPYNPFYGLSLFSAAARPILLDRHKNEFEMAFYLRGATNAGVIETTEDMTKARMERLMRTFEAAFTGKRNWWRTLFLPKGAKWINSGLTMNEMQHLEGLRENRRTILGIVGVPPSQVGIVEDVNRATAEVQKEALWTNTIQPLADLVASCWNNSYLVRIIYKGEVEVFPDFTGNVAVAGSLQRKGEVALSVQDYLVLNEIRKDILGYPELTDERGTMLVREIGPKLTNPFGEALPPAQAPAQDEDTETLEDPNAGVVEEGKTIKASKEEIIKEQERIEVSGMRKYIKVFDKYMGVILEQAVKAMKEKTDVRARLNSLQTTRANGYSGQAVPLLAETMEKGFVLGKFSAKSLSFIFHKKEFTGTDEQAIEILREKTRDGKRQVLAERAITNFLGFDRTRTELIMSYIEDGLKSGKTTEQIADTIAKDFGEKYRDQAFTIARTEVLYSVSQGAKWNQEVLGKVFSEINKQWIHVGDVGSNPAARQEHYDFQFEGKNGVVPESYTWINPKTGAHLGYPRDFNGGAADVINCRCTMANVIPATAVSNAEVILATE